MNKKLISFFLGCLILMGNVGGLFSARANDFQLWTELKVTATFPKKKARFLWAMENRFKDNATDYFLFNMTLGFDYRVLKWLRPGFFYRVEKEFEKDFAENRLIPTIEFLTHFGPIDFEDRNRFEIRFFTNDDIRFRYRNRMKFGHTFKASPVSFTPYASEEIFLETERTNPVQNRVIIGNTFGFMKDHIGFDLYFMLRSDKNQGSPGWDQKFVLGTSLGFKY